MVVWGIKGIGIIISQSCHISWNNFFYCGQSVIYISGSGRIILETWPADFSSFSFEIYQIIASHIGNGDFNIIVIICEADGWADL